MPRVVNPQFEWLLVIAVVIVTILAAWLLLRT